MGREEFEWGHHQLWNQHGPQLVYTVKSMIKAYSSGRMVSSGISDVVNTSVYCDKTNLKKLMIIMDKSQEATVFSGHQQQTSAIKLRPNKVGRL